MFGLGAPEMLLIIGGALLLFGGKKIPELMKGLGSGIKEFKKAATDVEEATTNQVQPPQPPSQINQ
ncbi:MAG: twin-arginine translocase TatA/TatE family subunit [Chlorobiota bacterium]|jgi:sec-independent protein translocase protein TatA|nr:twin-arginine translocase TatA/TatE family subunit [Chlorobiota bacterium]QQS66954.1 MAG: twin-arginine translocase TatA/TatE family subunit [Chlorobiota bacterium]